MECSNLIFQYFLNFISLACKFSSHFFSHFFSFSKLYEFLVLEFSRTFSVNLYLRPFSIAFYEKNNLHSLYLVCKLYKSGQQIMFIVSDHLRFLGSVDIRGFIREILIKVSFQFLVIFELFFLISKLYKSGLYIITCFGYRQCFI